MDKYTVIPDHSEVPGARFVATDLFDLGAQVAAYYARHALLNRDLPYEAQIGSDVGALNQHGLRKPHFFTITKDS